MFYIFFLGRLIYTRRVNDLYGILIDWTSAKYVTNEDARRGISDAFKTQLNWYYNAGKLHKADYEYLLKGLEGRMETKRLEEEVRQLLIAEEAPTKSVHKVRRYTSEGKPITDENKS